MIGREGHVKALYGKLGGRMAFPSVGTDKFNDPALHRWEPIETLKLLSDAYPDVDFIITSSHDGQVDGWRPNVFSAHEVFGTKKLIDVEPFLLELINTDSVEHIINWVGVNAVSQDIPKLDGSGPVKPLTSDQFNTAPLVRLINQWREKSPTTKCETWLWPDARYHLKVRDLKWPVTKPVVSQMDAQINLKLHRYGDPHGPDAYNYFEYGVKWAEGNRQTEHTDWVHAVQYEYAGLETLMAYGLPIIEPSGETVKHCVPYRKGTVCVANEVKRSEARYAMMDALPEDVSVIGMWETEPYARFHNPVTNDRLSSHLSTYRAGIIPTIQKNRGMATPKYWEYIRSGVVPIATPGYDEQRHLDIPFRCLTLEDLEWLVPIAEEYATTDHAKAWFKQKNAELHMRMNECLRVIMSESTYQL